MSRNYIVVTPAKNEEKNIPNLFASLENQTIKPILWVVVDDGSTDNTAEILKSVSNRCDFLHVLNHPSHERDLGKHYSNICNDAFNYCLNYCINNKLQCDYVGLVDADVVLEPTFFEKLITEFELKPLLGTISGSMYFESENGLIFEDIRDDLLIGSARLWRKKCFDDIGGFPISYSADSVSDVLAKLNGWGIYRMKDAIAIQARKMSTAEGNWKGQKINGKSAYFRNYHPLFVLFITIKKSFQHPYYIGLAFIIGYLESYFRHEGKIENDSIRNYYYCEKPKESLTYYYKKLFNFKGDKN